MNILYITSTYLGDAILSTGLLHTLTQKYPHAKITLACGKVPAPLFEKMPQLAQLIILTKKKLGLHWILLFFRCFFKKWDLVIDLRGTALSYFLWARARKIWQSQPINQQKSTQIAQLMGLKKTPFNHIWLDAKDIQKSDDLLPPSFTYIALAPGANWDKKRWPLEHFKTLALLLKESPNFSSTPLKFAFFGSTGEYTYLKPLIKALSPNSIDLVGTLSLREVAACLKRCTLFVGNDSGLSHLSATVGTPTLTIFGPTNWEIYRPWGGEVLTLTPESMTPSDAWTRCQKGEDLMHHIPPEKVLKKIMTGLRVN